MSATPTPRGFQKVVVVCNVLHCITEGSCILCERDTLRQVLLDLLNGRGHVVGCPRERQVMDAEARYCSIHCRAVHAALAQGEKGD